MLPPQGDCCHLHFMRRKLRLREAEQVPWGHGPQPMSTSEPGAWGLHKGSALYILHKPPHTTARVTCARSGISPPPNPSAKVGAADDALTVVLPTPTPPPPQVCWIPGKKSSRWVSIASLSHPVPSGSGPSAVGKEVNNWHNSETAEHQQQSSSGQPEKNDRMPTVKQMVKVQKIPSTWHSNPEKRASRTLF